MNLKIDNIRESLNSNGEVLISYKAFCEDATSMMMYYIRNQENESGPLLERALGGDLYAFGLEYLCRMIYPESNNSIAIEAISEDKLKLRKI